MEINRAAFGALALIGIIAAGGGGYLANRQSAPAADPAALYPAAMPGVVTETENTIASAPAALAEPVAPEPVRKAAPIRTNQVRRAPAPARRTEPAAERPRSASTRPSSTPAPVYTPPAAPVEAPIAPAVEPIETARVERARPPVAPLPPRNKIYDELVIPADSVIGLQVESAVSSDRAKLEDQVRARVTRDVRVRDQVAIPAGARAEGAVTLVEQGGRLKDQARLGIRFHTIVLADGTRVPINTDTIYREGDSPARESAAKIGGGAVGGAVLGAILGGKKGAVIGSTVGAAGGGVAVAASDPDPATLPAGSTVTVRMGAPAAVTVER